MTARGRGEVGYWKRCQTCGTPSGNHRYCMRCRERGRTVMSLENQVRSIREALQEDLHPYFRNLMEARLSVREEQLAVLKRDEAHLAGIRDDEVRKDATAGQGEMSVEKREAVARKQSKVQRARQQANGRGPLTVTAKSVDLSEGRDHLAGRINVG